MHKHARNAYTTKSINREFSLHKYILYIIIIRNQSCFRLTVLGCTIFIHDYCMGNWCSLSLSSNAITYVCKINWRIVLVLWIVCNFLLLQREKMRTITYSTKQSNILTYPTQYRIKSSNNNKNHKQKSTHHVAEYNNNVHCVCACMHVLVLWSNFTVIKTWGIEFS